MARVADRLPSAHRSATERSPFGGPPIASYSYSDTFKEEEAYQERKLSENPSLGQPSASWRPAKLHPYQQVAIEQLNACVRGGARSPLLVLPTGSGKTVIAAELTREVRDRGGRTLFVMPRRELVTQGSRQFTRAGIEHGVLLAGARGQQDLYAQTQIASVDTLLSRVIRRQRLALLEPDLIIVDEAHLSITAARRALFDLWPSALRIGLTATPTRKDGRALGLLYDALIEPITTAELMAKGYLVRARYFSLAAPDLARVRTVAGDYNAKDLEEAVNRVELVADVVETWLVRAAKRRTVVFAASVAHSVALRDAFLHAGVAAEHVDATTPQDLRDQIFARFTSGATQLLCNCQLATYGFDLPELDAIVLAKPTKSLMLYLQMLGRGLRIADGKTDCLVLDHSGVVHRFGFAHEPRAWTLEGERAYAESTAGGPHEARQTKNITCPECSAVFAGRRTCPECDYHIAPRGKEIKTLDGELIEVGEHLEPEHQSQLVFFAELRGLAIERGWKPGWAAHQYRERHGAWPPRRWNDLPAAAPTLTTRRWVTSRQIAYRKQRERTAGAAA
jgi:superfamily II DNA or RNA helicase